MHLYILTQYQTVFFPSKVEVTLRCQLWNFGDGLGHSRTLASAYVLHQSLGVLDLLAHLESIRGERRTDVLAWQH